MKEFEKKRMVLAGDIGGTKTHLGLFHSGVRRPKLKILETYVSQDATGLEEIIGKFLDRHPQMVSSACFGVAGPVKNGRCKTTNLPWEVHENRIMKRFGWQNVRLINDVSATAMAIPILTSRELFSLNDRKIHKNQNIGLVAPGTGLGQALLVWNKGRYIAVPSEGGHVDFAPSSEREIDLFKYLKKRFCHVSVERVLSGPGLVDIYNWLKETSSRKEPKWLINALQKSDPAMVISDSAIGKRNPICVEALKTFVSIFGSVAGNYALTGLTTGGVFLGGGIPPKILPAMKDDIFMNSFSEKGRFRGLLQKIPVRVILNDKAALLGAASCASNEG